MAYSAAEIGYQLASLQKSFRIDGRTRSDFRNLSLNTSVSPQANGSASVNLGGSEIHVGVKLETEDLNASSGRSGGKIECLVEWCVLANLCWSMKA